LLLFLIDDEGRPRKKMWEETEGSFGDDISRAVEQDY
jgi:hypothetical protein